MPSNIHERGTSMSDNINDLILVDRSSGEVIDATQALEAAKHEGRIEALQARQRQAEGYKAKLAVEEVKQRANHRQFIKVDSMRMDAMNKDLSLLDAGLLFKLALNLRLGCGEELVKGVDKKPLKLTEIGRILGRKESGTKSAVKRLLELGVLRKEGRSYFINADLISIGAATNSRPFAKVYRTQAKELLDKLTDSEAGLILKATPYINYHFLVLTHNPNEQDAEAAQPLRLQELAEVLGINEDHAKVCISKLKRKGVIATFDTGTKGKAIMIHPYLCDRGNAQDEIADTVTRYFKLATN